MAGQPVAVFMRGFAQIVLHGDANAARGATRALIAQLFTFHSPDDVRIAACCGEQTAADWEWIKWLPHSQHHSENDAVGPLRALRPTLTELIAMFGPEFSDRPRHEPGAAPNRDEPYVVVILDGGDVGEETRFAGASPHVTGTRRLPERGLRSRVRPLTRRGHQVLQTAIAGDSGSHGPTS